MAAEGDSNGSIFESGKQWIYRYQERYVRGQGRHAPLDIMKRLRRQGV